MYRLNEVYREAKDSSLQDKNVMPLTGAIVTGRFLVHIIKCYQQLTIHYVFLITISETYILVPLLLAVCYLHSL